MRRLALLSFLTLWVLVPGLGTQAQFSGVHVRFANLSPSLDSVDVVLNRGRSARNLAFGQITEWHESPARDYAIILEANAETPNVLNFTPIEFEASEGGWFTIVVLGTQDTQRIRVLNENYAALNSGDARLTVLYAVDNAEAIDLMLDGVPLYRGLKPSAGQTENADDVLIVDLVANLYDLTFAKADDTSTVYTTPGQIELIADTNTFVVLYDQPDNPRTFIKVDPIGETGRTALEVTPSPTEVLGTALLRVSHLSSGTPSLEFFINGQTLNTYLGDRARSVAGLRFPEMSEWVALPAGTINLAITIEGETLAEALIPAFEVPLAPGTYTTVAALGALANNTFEAHVFTEDYGPTNPGSVRLGILNAHPGTGPINVMLGEDEQIISQLGYPGFFGSNDGFSEVILDEGEYDLTLVTANDEQTLAIVPDRDLRPGRNYFLAVISANPPYYFTFSDLSETEALMAGRDR